MLRVRCHDSHHAERAYVLDVVLARWLGLSFELIFEERESVSFQCPGAGSKELLMPDRLFAGREQDWPRRSTQPAFPPDSWNPALEFPWWPERTCQALPVLFATRTQPQYWIEDGQHYHLEIDILGTVFWVLTRMEEVLCPVRDEHQRYPASASYAYRSGILEMPIVDGWVRVLGAILLELWPELPKPQLQGSIRPSHDVDRPFKFLFQPAAGLLRRMGGDAIRRKQWISALMGPYQWWQTRHGDLQADPFQTFQWIMDQSEGNGLRSAFYFICGHTGGLLDGDYDVGHPAIRGLLRSIHARGHEIGLHASYNTFQSPELLSREFAKLRQVCQEEGIQQEHWGGRHHVLRFEVPTTWAAWESAGLDYDASMGFADHPGFRCGTSKDFPVFDVIGRRSLRLLERPLIAMDVSLLANRYEGLSPAEAADKLLLLRRNCLQEGGHFNLLWHNCQMEERAYRAVYQTAIRYTGQSEQPAL